MEQGLVVGVAGKVLRLERAGNLVQEVRLGELGEVLVFGAITLTPGAVAALLDRRLDVVFLTARGRYRGRLLGRSSRNVELRMAHQDMSRDRARCLAVAKAIVQGKLANQRNLLLRAQREHRRADLAEAIGAIRQVAERVPEAADLDAVRGLEGAAAARYFPALGTCVRQSGFEFTVRSRRPPRDPANALLSFGYTLLTSLVESLALRVGLEPQVGCLHVAEYGRPSLALDLIEEMRPVLVDSMMLRLVNRRELAREDFDWLTPGEDDPWSDEAVASADEAGARGTWLNESGRKIFFRAWGRRLREVAEYAPQQRRLAYEQIVEQQVYHFARVVKGEDAEYAAFVPR
jgi:CRISPR-associated protein Cas1